MSIVSSAAGPGLQKDQQKLLVGCAPPCISCPVALAARVERYLAHRKPPPPRTQQ